MTIEKLLQLLNDHNVKYVIIGATAFPVHGYVRATMDIDLFIEATKNNAQKSYKCLKEFGYDVTEISIDDLLNKKLLIRQYVIETDIHPFVAGVSFDEVWEKRIYADYKSIKAPFADLDSLIKMKKAANRAKDIEDLKHLRKLKWNE